MELFESIFKFLLLISVATTALISYLTINKMWPRKHDPLVVESISPIAMGMWISVSLPLAGSSLSWLMQMPYAIEILCSTAHEGEVLTECSATCINYKDFESKVIRRSFTCQFHPELLSDLRVVGFREPPAYAELKKDDEARLFARLIYAGMQE